MNRRGWRGTGFLHALALILAAAQWQVGGAAETVPPLDQRALIAKLIDKVRTPYSTRAFDVILADLQRNMSTQLIDGFGSGAKLPAEWQRGNPYWERAHARLLTALKDEEMRAGPIFVIRRADVLASFNPPWSTEDLEFVVATVDTEFGSNYVRFLDMMLVPAFIATFRNMKEVSPAALAQLQELETEAKKEIGPVTVSMMSMEQNEAKTAKRLQELIARLNREEGRKFGESMMKPILARLIGAMYGCASDIYRIAEEFRRAPRSSPTRSSET